MRGMKRSVCLGQQFNATNGHCPVPAFKPAFNSPKIRSYSFYASFSSKGGTRLPRRLNLLLTVFVGVALGLYVLPKAPPIQISAPPTSSTQTSSHAAEVEPLFLNTVSYPPEIEQLLRTALLSLHSTRRRPDAKVVLSNLQEAWRQAREIAEWSGEGQEAQEWWRTVSGIGIRFASIFEHGIRWGDEEILEPDLIQSLLILSEVKEYLGSLALEGKLLENREKEIRRIRLGIKCASLRFALFQETDVSSSSMSRRYPLRSLFLPQKDPDELAELKDEYLRMAYIESKSSLSDWLTLLHADPTYNKDAMLRHAVHQGVGDESSSVEYLPSWVPREELGESFLTAAEIAEANNVLHEARFAYSLGIALCNDFRTQIIAWCRMIMLQTRAREFKPRPSAPTVLTEFRSASESAQIVFHQARQWMKNIESALSSLEEMKGKMEEDAFNQAKLELMEDKETCMTVIASISYTMAALSMALQRPITSVEDSIKTAHILCSQVGNVNCLRVLD
ncbi:hypothetical protein BT69DRAFT_1276634, partial [Atractiella rhizophila]